MKILNLIEKTKGDIGYNVIIFPDGEPHIVLDELDRKQEITVICRITNPDELFIVMQVGSILNRQDVGFHLIVSYLMGMRMDRVMSFNEAFSLKIIANCINSVRPLSVRIVEPHSGVSGMLINRAQSVSVALIDSITSDVICFPDKGAKDRYEYEQTDKPILYCSKVRNTETGELSGFKIENPEEYEGGDITVVDDLCDKGGTFVGIAKELRNLAPNAKIGIFVTHMVNPIGITALSNNYNTVKFTDSYSNWNNQSLPENVSCMRIFESVRGKGWRLYDNMDKTVLSVLHTIR